MLKLTQDNGMPIYLRLEGILAIAAANDKTMIYIGGGTSFQVKESFEDIERLSRSIIPSQRPLARR